MRHLLAAAVAIPFLVPAAAAQGPTVTTEVKEYEVPYERTRPRDPYVAPDGRIWFVGQVGNYLAVLNPTSGQIDRVEIDEGTHPHNVIVDTRGRAWYAGNPNGMIWYVDYARGFLGRVDPRSGEVKEWASPSGRGALPYAMASDDLGRLWYVETGPRANRLVAFDPATERFIVNQAVGIEGPNTIRHMVFHSPTRSIWYGSDANMIGRIAVPRSTAPVP